MPAPFDGFHERACRVFSTALVSFERNRYSVECQQAGHAVALRAYATHIVIVLEGVVIGEHACASAWHAIAMAIGSSSRSSRWWRCTDSTP